MPYSGPTLGLGCVVLGSAGPARPTNFANCPNFAWVLDEGSNIWRFLATYGNPWTSAQLNDVQALSESTISVSGNYLQCTNNGTSDIMRGFRFRQVHRTYSIVESCNAVAGTPVTYGYAFAQSNSLSFDYATADVYGSGNATMAGAYEINPGDWSVNSGGTCVSAEATWWTFTHTFSGSAISVVRNDLGTPYSDPGTYTTSTSLYAGCCSWYTSGLTVQWGQITISGAVAV
jgi:hypothetical protein